LPDPNPLATRNQSAEIKPEPLTMKRPFSPNISNSGRLIRSGIALLLFVGAGFGFATSMWLGLALVASGGFVLFEALRGWCVLRACGIKTKF
jgi:hypothetical protein